MSVRNVLSLLVEVEANGWKTSARSLDIATKSNRVGSSVSV